MNLYEEILKNKSGGRTLFLLGNEAVARGAIEAGISTATTYPGTPSSEVGDVFAEISERAGIHFEYSVNEKVALYILDLSSLTRESHAFLDILARGSLGLILSDVM